MNRDEIAAVWPDAIWMPWDDPPAGAEVLLAADGKGYRRPARVLARYHGPLRRPHDCPSCGCKPLSPVRDGLWIVEWLDVWGSPKESVEVGSGFRFVPVGSEDAAPIHALVYPPSLGRV